MKPFITAALFTAVLLAGCANTIAKLKGPDANLNYADYAGEPIQSFWMSRVDGWASISDREIVVRSDIKKAYLVKVAGFCPDLKFAATIGITSSADQVDRFSKVVVGHDQCLISEIRPIDMARMNADRKALREQAKK